MGNQMTTSAAKALIAKFHEEGLNNVEIAKRLKDKGYISPRTDAPIDQYGVGYHVRNMKANKVSVKLATPAEPKKEAGPSHPANGHVGIQGERKSRFRLAVEIMRSDLNPELAAQLAEQVLNA